MKIQEAFTQPLNEAHIYTENGINVDIRDYLEHIFPKAVKQCYAVEKIFKGRTELETAFNIWQYLRKYCTYRKDPNSNQIIRLPAYFVNRGKRTGDCKTFALFARSVYAAIYPDLETAFKFTAYKKGAANPSHVYTVVKDRAGRQIIIDGCWPRFNSEKKFTLALPINYTTMKITSLSGTGTDTLNYLNENIDGVQRDKIKRLAKCRKDLKLYRTEYEAGTRTKGQYMSDIAAIRSEVEALNGISKKLTPEQKAARKKKRVERNKKAKKGAKKFLWGIAFVNLIPIRAAFASVVAMNVNALAHNLKYVYEARNGKTKAEWNKIKSIWKKLGGIEKALLKAIQIGAKHKPLFMSKKAKKRFEKRKAGMSDYIGALYINDDNTGEGINIAPAVIAAALAMAGGVVAAMIPAIMGALGKLGKKKEQAQVGEEAQQIVQEYKQNPNQPAQEAAEAADQETESMGAMGADGWSTLFDTLGKVAEVGVKAAGNAIQKKAAKKPKLKKFLDQAGTGADDYITGRYLRESGYKKAAQDFQSGASKYLPYGLAAAAVAALALFLKKK